MSSLNGIPNCSSSSLEAQQGWSLGLIQGLLCSSCLGGSVVVFWKGSIIYVLPKKELHRRVWVRYRVNGLVWDLRFRYVCAEFKKFPAYVSPTRDPKNGALLAPKGMKFLRCMVTSLNRGAPIKSPICSSTVY